MAITALVSLACFNNRDLKYRLTFSPYAAKHHNRWYTVFSHALVHADYLHLGVNMFVLYSFGKLTESILFHHFGMKGFFLYALLYIGGIAFATLPAFRRHSDNPGYLAVGASGAVSAVLFASIMLLPFIPNGKGISLIFLPFLSIQPFFFGLLYLAYEVIMDRRGRDNVAHDAHFWGAIFGAVFIVAVRPATIPEFWERFLLWLDTF